MDAWKPAPTPDGAPPLPGSGGPAMMQDADGHPGPTHRTSLYPPRLLGCARSPCHDDGEGEPTGHDRNSVSMGLRGGREFVGRWLGAREILLGEGGTAISVRSTMRPWQAQTTQPSRECLWPMS